MVICAICMCSNGTIVTDIFVGTVYLAIVEGKFLWLFVRFACVQMEL